MLAAPIVVVPGVVTASACTLAAEHEVPNVQTPVAGAGRRRGLYDTAEGEITTDVVARTGPNDLRRRSVRPDHALGEAWTHNTMV